MERLLEFSRDDCRLIFIHVYGTAQVALCCCPFKTKKQRSFWKAALLEHNQTEMPGRVSVVGGKRLGGGVSVEREQGRSVQFLLASIRTQLLTST